MIQDIVNPNVQLVVDKLTTAMNQITEGGKAVWPVLAEETSRRAQVEVTVLVFIAVFILIFNYVLYRMQRASWQKSEISICDDAAAFWVIPRVILGIASIIGFIISLVYIYNSISALVSPNLELAERLLHAAR